MMETIKDGEERLRNYRPSNLQLLFTKNTVDDLKEDKV